MSCSTRSSNSELYPFELRASTGDSYQFAASSVGDKQAWIKALNRNMKSELFGSPQRNNNKDANSEKSADSDGYEKIDDPEDIDESPYAYSLDEIVSDTLDNTFYLVVRKFDEKSNMNNQIYPSSGYKKASTLLATNGNAFLKENPSLFKRKKTSSISTRSFPNPRKKSLSVKKSTFEMALWGGDPDKARNCLLYINVDGTFLIRNTSSGDPFIKTLLVSNRGHILKFRIHMKKDGSCSMSGLEFQTGQQLIDYYNRNYLPDCSQKLGEPYLTYKTEHSLTLCYPT